MLNGRPEISAISGVKSQIAFADPPRVHRFRGPGRPRSLAMVYSFLWLPSHKGALPLCLQPQK